MGVVAVLLDTVRTCRSLASDNALATAMHVKRQTVSQWRSGTSYPDETKLAQLIEMAGGDSGWALRVEKERAKGPMAKVWADLAKRLGTAAALLVMVTMTSGTGVAGDFGSGTRNECILRAVRRWLNSLGRLGVSTLSDHQIRA